MVTFINKLQDRLVVERKGILLAPASNLLCSGIDKLYCALAVQRNDAVGDGVDDHLGFFCHLAEFACQRMIRTCFVIRRFFIRCFPGAPNKKADGKRQLTGEYHRNDHLPAERPIYVV